MTAPASSAVPPDVTVVGIGADGWDGLTRASRAALCEAEVLIGGARQLALLPDECAGERVAWPTPLRPAVPALLAAHAGRRIAVLASGDPMHFGVGRALAEVLGAGVLGAEALGTEALGTEALGTGVPRALPRVLPHPPPFRTPARGWAGRRRTSRSSALSGAPSRGSPPRCTRGGGCWSSARAPATPSEVATLLRERGFGPSLLRVLEQLGGERERSYGATADDWPHPPGDPLNIVAVECVRDPGGLRLGAVPGLPDTAYEHDGQLTKRHVRAATLAALAPAPGELLWDIGGGAGSVAVEWLRTHPACRAVTVERDPERAARIARNAERLGVPGLRVVTGTAPGALEDSPPPTPCSWAAASPRPACSTPAGRRCPRAAGFVANTVTLESEALLADRYRRHGGELVRLAVAHAVPVGGFTGWRQAMPVTQWSVRKGGPAPAAPSPPVAGDDA